MRTWLGVVICFFVLAPSVDGADVADLIRKMKDSDSSTRRQAARELSELGPEAREALAALISGLKDHDLYVRRFSAQAIGKIGPDAGSALPALRSGAMNPRETKEVQEAMIAAIAKLGKGGVEVLIAAIKDKGKDPEVRRKAVESLGDLGPDARSAVSALVEALQGGAAGKKGGPPPTDIRMEVCTALGLIAGSKDESAIKALEMISTEKGKNKTLKTAAKDALKAIKARD